MSTSGTGRRWVTIVACPHCREDHQVCWPHPSYPSGSPRYSFECPSTSLRVVFSATCPWGELVGEAPPQNAPAASPFSE